MGCLKSLYGYIAPEGTVMLYGGYGGSLEYRVRLRLNRPIHHGYRLPPFTSIVAFRKEFLGPLVCVFVK